MPTLDTPTCTHVATGRCPACTKAASQLAAKRRRTYAKLGITETDVKSAPVATPFLLRLGGTATAIDALSASPEPAARSFMAAYRSPKLTSTDHYYLPFEAYCVAAKVCPSRITEIVVGVLAKQQVLEGAVIAALAHPTIMRANVAAAAFAEGVTDRMAHLKMVGAMPLPKSSQTVVNVTATANAVAAARSDSANLPSAEETIRKIVEAQQQARSLTEDRQAALPPAPTVSMPFMPRHDRELVTVDGDLEASDDDVSSD
jgi:hypothetical protein